MGSAPDAGPDDIDAAVQAARTAFRESGWPQLAPKERARYLRPGGLRGVPDDQIDSAPGLRSPSIGPAAVVSARRDG